MKQYFHIKCIFESFLRARATTKKIEETSDLDGFENMEEEEKTAIRKHIADMSKIAYKKTIKKTFHGVLTAAGKVVSPTKPVPTPAASSSSTNDLQPFLTVARRTIINPCSPQRSYTRVFSRTQVDNFLDRLVPLTREQEQQNELAKITRRCTSKDLKMIVRLIKHNFRINAGSKPMDEFSHGQVNASSERRDVCFKEEEGIFVMILKNHLCQVIKILTQAILTHITLKDCSGYRTEELQCLLIIMMRIALDKTVIGLPVAVDITMAIAAILEGFEDSVWHQEVERMCVLFPLISSHHHNMVYLLWSCMPLHIERGRYLCRRLSYAGLQNLVLPEKNTQRLSSSLHQNVPSIKISSLIPILQCCKPSTATDYYQLYSIIHLLDYSIGNEVLEIYEKRELDQIIRKLREMVGDIRESTLSLCRSQVKSLIVRTATKLSFMTQSMVTNQESIFSFLRSDTPIGMDKDEEEGNPEHHIRS